MPTKEELELAIKTVEAAISRIDTYVLLFGSLVAIGVTGETILGIRHWIKDRQLRNLRGIEARMHESEILGLQGKIADANALAQTTALQAAALNKEAKQAEQKISEAFGACEKLPISTFQN